MPNFATANKNNYSAMTQIEMVPADIRVLSEQIYLYKKGVRQLVLYTLPRCYEELAKSKLRNQGIDYLVQRVGDRVINLYFGHRARLDTIRHLVDRPLSELSPEEDFMLGALLGYDLTMQCERYAKRKGLAYEKRAMAQ